MGSFDVQKINDNEVILKIHEPVINATVADSLKNTLYEFLDSNIKNVTVDLMNVERIGSNGIGKLLLFYKKLKENNGYLRITGLNEEIVKTFKLLKLDNLFDIQ